MITAWLEELSAVAVESDVGVVDGCKYMEAEEGEVGEAELAGLAV